MDKRAGEVVVETESGACKHMVVLGATSDIAVALSRSLLKGGSGTLVCVGVMKRRCGN